MTFGGQTPRSSLLGKYLGLELLSHSEQFSQAVEPMYTVTSPGRGLGGGTASRQGLPGKQAGQQSLVCGCL